MSEKTDDTRAKPRRRLRDKQLHLWLSDRERRNLELLRDAHELTMASAARAMLWMGFVEIGIEKDISDGLKTK